MNKKIPTKYMIKISKEYPRTYFTVHESILYKKTLSFQTSLTKERRRNEFRTREYFI